MKKLFVVIRKDLNPVHQMVQSGHVIAEFIRKTGKVADEDMVLVILSAKDLDDLKRIIFKLNVERISWIGFKEPDLDNQLTAIASDEENIVFQNLNLIDFN